MHFHNIKNSAGVKIFLLLGQRLRIENIHLKTICFQSRYSFPHKEQPIHRLTNNYKLINQKIK